MARSQRIDRLQRIWGTAGSAILRGKNRHVSEVRNGKSLRKAYCTRRRALAAAKDNIRIRPGIATRLSVIFDIARHVIANILQRGVPMLQCHDPVIAVWIARQRSGTAQALA